MEVIELTKDNLDAMVRRPHPEAVDHLAAVTGILEAVADRGDAALLEFTAEFDDVVLTADQLRLSAEEIAAGVDAVPPEVIEALKTAADRIRVYHEHQARESWFINENGIRLGQRISALGRVGAYVPGGRADYPSSVMMNVIPAQVAGVPEIAVCCPPDSQGIVSPYVLAAADLLGIDEIYRIGGAQAIAAMAYGTESIPRVDKITGPGNIFVTLAKKLAVGDVGIDMLAGPSEVVIIADDSADPDYVAADILAQAEHDPNATAILVTTSRRLALAAAAAVEDQLEHLSRREIAVQSLQTNGKALIAADLDLAVEFVNTIAPEHLQIMTTDPESLLERIDSAGAVFLGNYTPEALGDYIAGSNHILPTGGTARFYSPLGVDDFIKKTSVLSFTEKAAGGLTGFGETIAKVEGLDAHAKSLTIRRRKT